MQLFLHIGFNPWAIFFLRLISLVIMLIIWYWFLFPLYVKLGISIRARCMREIYVIKTIVLLHFVSNVIPRTLSIDSFILLNIIIPRFFIICFINKSSSPCFSPWHIFRLQNASISSKINFWVGQWFFLELWRRGSWVVAHSPYSSCLRRRLCVLFSCFCILREILRNRPSSISWLWIISR